jgi:hypothetical protein
MKLPLFYTNFILILRFGSVEESLKKKGMMMKRFISLALLLMLVSGCTLSYVSNIPMEPRVGRLEAGKIPLEVGLRITPEARDSIFRSPDYPDFHGRPILYPIEPYQLPIGEAFEKVCLEAFSQLFEKVTLIRNSEEGKNYRLVIEPQLSHFSLDLFYTNYGNREGIYGEVVNQKCQVKVSGTLKSYGRTIWEKTLETPLETLNRVNNFQLRFQVASLASDTIVLGVKTLAYQMIQESQGPPPARLVRPWLEEVSPAR